MSISEPVANADDADALRLAELGYTQELHRRMSGFSNFAVSFSIISILAGCITLVLLRHERRRPGRPSSWGWPIVGLHGPVRRPGHGRGLLGLPDRRRPLLLGRRGWPQQQARRGPGSPAGSTSSARSRSPRRSTSAPPSPEGVPRTCSSASRSPPGARSWLFVVILLLHGAAEHVRRQAGRAAQRHQRLVARRRRRGHRRRRWRSCRTSTSRVAWTFTEFAQQHRLEPSRSTSCCSACCWPSTPTPGYDASAHMTEETHDASAAARAAS